MGFGVIFLGLCVVFMGFGLGLGRFLPFDLFLALPTPPLSMSGQGLANPVAI